MFTTSRQKRMNINLHGQKDSDLRTLKGQDYPGSSRCAHSNHMSPFQAVVTGSVSAEERTREMAVGDSSHTC